MRKTLLLFLQYFVLQTSSIHSYSYYSEQDRFDFFIDQRWEWVKGEELIKFKEIHMGNKPICLIFYDSSDQAEFDSHLNPKMYQLIDELDAFDIHLIDKLSMTKKWIEYFSLSGPRTYFSGPHGYRPIELIFLDYSLNEFARTYYSKKFDVQHRNILEDQLQARSKFPFYFAPLTSIQHLKEHKEDFINQVRLGVSRNRVKPIVKTLKWMLDSDKTLDEKSIVTLLLSQIYKTINQDAKALKYAKLTINLSNKHDELYKAYETIDQLGTSEDKRKIEKKLKKKDIQPWFKKFLIVKQRQGSDLQKNLPRKVPISFVDDLTLGNQLQKPRILRPISLRN